jgi:hypothetical protein
LDQKLRLVFAEIAAGLTLAVSALYPIGFYDKALAAGRGTTLLAIGLSIVAFVLCLKIKSLLVGSLLIFGGVLLQLPQVLAIISERAIEVPGPIFGVISFSPVLIFGITKTVRSRKNLAIPKTTEAIQKH